MTRKIVVAVAPVSHHVGTSPQGPVSPEEVAAEVIACANAGAGLVHLHVRDRKGRQTEALSIFSETIDLIRASSNIVIQGSTGGLSSLSLEQRCGALNKPWVETASLTTWDRSTSATTLLPADIHWGIVHAGMQDFGLLATAVGMGASMVRVGFEDSPCYAPGKTAATNAQLVEKIVSLVRMLGCEAAGPEEARAILGLQ